jgi:hypothetical protein
MARIFDIRFARNAGLAAWFEAPANSFRWKGPGRISIDDHWLVFARSRLFWPFARLLHRLPVSALTSVYREGSSLRLEFAGSPQLVVPIWARDHADAAEIVRLVPTNRTVEVDAPPSRPASSAHRSGGLALVVLGAILGVTATLAIIGMRRADDDVQSAGARAEAIAIREVDTSASAEPASSGGVAADAPAAHSRAARAVPVSASAPGLVARSVAPSRWAGDDAAAPAGVQPANARSTLGAGSAVIEDSYAGGVAASRSDFFRAAALALRSDHVDGRLPPGELERRWWALSQRLYSSPEFDDWRTHWLVDAQLGVSLNWRISLTNYRNALATGDRAQIDAAQAELESAAELTDRVVQFSW